jgi:hypothetical protein
MNCNLYEYIYIYIYIYIYARIEFYYCLNDTGYLVLTFFGCVYVFVLFRSRAYFVIGLWAAE